MIKKFFRLFILSLFPVLGLFVLYMYFKKPNVQSVEDLTFVEGRIKDYSFKYKGRGGKEFYIWIEGYESKFQIIAEYISEFHKGSFENNLKVGDSLKIGIPKEQMNKLDEDDRIRIMSIESKSFYYLSYINTIKEEKNHTEITVAIVFFFIGILFYKLEENGIIKIE